MNGMSGSGDPDGEGNVSDGAGTGEGSLEKGKLIHAWRFDPRYRLLHGGSRALLRSPAWDVPETITGFIKRNGRVDISNVK